MLEVGVGFTTEMDTVCTRVCMPMRVHAHVFVHQEMAIGMLLGDTVVRLKNSA